MERTAPHPTRAIADGVPSVRGQKTSDRASGLGATGAAISSGLTARAFFVGALFSFFISVGAPYGNMALRGSYMALDFTTAAAVFMFFVLTGIVNVLLGLIRRSWALTGPELATTYIMMIVATSIPTMGLTEYLLPIITGGFYYATPENDWANLIHPYIPDWMVLQNEEATKYFYEGMPKGFDIPWGVWIRPLIYWSAFILVLYFVMICIMVVLRKQWIEKERLIFPLIQVPTAMIEEDERGSLIRPFFKSPIMWIGFLIPFLIGSVRALHNYYNFIPTINLQTTVPIFRRTTSLQIALSFPMVGFSYFINLDIAFGIWFFNLLAKIQEGSFAVLGIESTEKLDYTSGSPILAHQGMGAMIVLVVFGLWIARGHIRDVLRKAFRGASDVDDSGEMLSYRTAVFGILGGNLFMGIWLWASGMPAAIIPMFLGAAFLIFVAITRIVAEGGVAVARAPLIASNFVSSGIGTSAIGPAGLTSLGFTYIWGADVRTFVMASCANGLKLAEEKIGARRKQGLFWAMMLAILVSFAGSVWIVMWLSYTYGGINLNQWFFRGGAVYPFNYIARELSNPTSANWEGWAWTGLGATVMALLMFARHRLLWWPIHPLGFPISTIWMTNYISFSVFLAWLIKSVILKYGGPSLYQKARPFFLGLILGQFVCAGGWLIVDYFTGMTDNNIYWI